MLWLRRTALFPFLFGGTFIEGGTSSFRGGCRGSFPFLFGGTFIEGNPHHERLRRGEEFPFLFGGTFIEGFGCISRCILSSISLPFRRDFH